MEPLLTVAVIARDEERTLPSLIASLRGLTDPDRMEIVVVDTGSLDATPAVAASLGAVVHRIEWRDDFSAARNRSLEASRGKWILWMDADDLLPSATRDWLGGNLPRLDPGLAYAFRVRSPGPDGSESHCDQIRLIPNGRGLAFRNPVHESIGESVLAAGLSVAASGLEILHTGYRDAGEVERKRVRNRALLAKAAAAPSAPASLRLAWGRMLMGENDYPQAESAFRGALSRPAGTPPELLLAARINLGQSLCFQNRAPEALQVYRSVDNGNAHAPYLLEYGKALWLTGHVAEARSAWTACLNAFDAPGTSGAGPRSGAVPTDWEGVRAGAGILLKETPAARPPSRSTGNPVHPEAPPNRGGGGKRMDLTVCSIVRDEEANLEGLLAGIPLGRVEWIVMDTGSKDATSEILLQAGIKTHRFAWCDDFSAARNASLELATRGWILWIDADDRLEETFWDGIQALLDGPRRGYRFLVRSPRENSRGDCFRQIRLFPNDLGIRFEGRVHEQLGTSMQKLRVPIENADLEILHMGYDTAAKRGAKLKRNRALLEQERLAHPRDPAVIMEYGNCLYQSGEYTDAKAAYLRLMPSQQPRSCGAPPDDEVLRHFPTLLGETCLKQGAETEAGEWFRLAAAWNPSDIMPCYWLGKKALESGNVHGALEYFYAAVDRPVSVGRVATDNHTVRRNALALVVLCEMKLFGPERAPRGRQCLRELIEGGLRDFPLEPRVPWEFLLAAGSGEEAVTYARAYLKLAPGDMAMWEDLAEHLFGAGRHREVLEIFADRPGLRLQTGILEAFRAKCMESFGSGTGEIYEAYLEALRKFPEDPTLLVYFSDFVNHNKLYARCYADLKAMARPSGTVRDFLRQMEAQGYGNGGHVQSE
ncbi:MAG: putative glycosyl transferase family 2 protein [Fibrobacteres bacterium]|nr:putative glycosyl transferase family 2 protein [Fibrobacterota bacterium]